MRTVDMGSTQPDKLSSRPRPNSGVAADGDAYGMTIPSQGGMNAEWGGYTGGLGALSPAQFGGVNGIVAMGNY